LTYAKKIIDTLPLEENFILIGHSMGGYIALEAAKLFPSRIDGVIMLHSTMLADSPEKQTQRDKTVAFIQEKGSEIFIKSFVSNLFAPHFVGIYPDLMTKLANRYSDISQAGLIASTLAMKNRQNMERFIQSTDIPFLFILGSEDPLIPVKSVVDIIGEKDQQKYVILSGVAHQGCYEAPAETLAAINQFIVEIHA
jgi:pimeloyl-ACP methyl ester carboxylesterase